MTIKLRNADSEIFFNDLRELRAWFTTFQWPDDTWLLNMVSNKHGRTTDAHASSRGLSNEFDLQALVGLRQQADAVLTTAVTARAEQYRSASGRSLVLVSRSGDFSGIPAVETYESVLLVTDASSLAKCEKLASQGRVQVVGIQNISLSKIRAKLAEMALAKVVVEAGVTFSRELIACKVLDFLALSLTGVNDSDVRPADEILKVLGITSATELWSASCGDTRFYRFALNGQRL